MARLRRKHICNLFVGDNDILDGILLAFEVIEIVIRITRKEDLCAHATNQPMARKLPLNFEMPRGGAKKSAGDREDHFRRRACRDEGREA